MGSEALPVKFVERKLQERVLLEVPDTNKASGIPRKIVESKALPEPVEVIDSQSTYEAPEEPTTPSEPGAPKPFTEMAEIVDKIASTIEAVPLEPPISPVAVAPHYQAIMLGKVDPQPQTQPTEQVTRTTEQPNIVAPIHVEFYPVTEAAEPTRYVETVVTIDAVTPFQVITAELPEAYINIDIPEVTSDVTELPADESIRNNVVLEELEQWVAELPEAASYEPSEEAVESTLELLLTELSELSEIIADKTDLVAGPADFDADLSVAESPTYIEAMNDNSDPFFVDGIQDQPVETTVTPDTPVTTETLEVTEVPRMLESPESYESSPPSAEHCFDDYVEHYIAALDEVPTVIAEVHTKAAAEAPLEQTLAALYTILETGTRLVTVHDSIATAPDVETAAATATSEEIEAVANLITELYESIYPQHAELASGTPEQPQITRDMAEKLLVLLSTLGYENPQDTLREFLERHDLAFLLQAIRGLYQLNNQADRHESLSRKFQRLAHSALEGERTIAERIGSALLRPLHASIEAARVA